MANLALPSASVNSPAKKRKRTKKDKDKDEEEEIDVSADDLVAAEGERVRGDGDEDDDEDEGEQQPQAATGVDVKREAKRRRDETLLLRGMLDEEQGKRFDAFRSAVIPKAVVKKLNKDLYDQHIPNNLTAVVAGMVKIFVADVVETAREMQPHSAHPEGPLQPYHFQLAKQRLQERGLLGAPAGAPPSQRSTTGLRARKRLFRR